MSIVIIAESVSYGPTSGNDHQSATDSTGGTLLLAYVFYDAGSTPVIQDSKLNTWTLVDTASNSTATYPAVKLYYVNRPDPTVGPGHQISFTSGGATGFVVMRVCSGTGAAPLDTHSSNTNYSGTTSIGATNTPGGDNELIVSILATGPNSIGQPSCDSGFGAGDYIPSTNGLQTGGSGAELVQTTGGSVTPTWTWSGSANFGATITASFRPTGQGIVQTLSAVAGTKSGAVVITGALS